MILLMQAITVLFAICCGLLNEIPVVKMIQYSASLNDEKKFHRANACVKIIYALAVTLALNLHLIDRIIVFHLLLLIQWLVFDIALNLCLKKTWDYIGETAQIDKLLNKIFPHGDAGEVKAALCLSMIIALNILLYYL